MGNTITIVIVLLVSYITIAIYIIFSSSYLHRFTCVTILLLYA
jgi:hypothetical protein